MSQVNQDERAYQQNYYREHRAERSRTMRDKWRNDPTYRARERERAHLRRGELRARRAATRFEEMVAAKRENAEDTRPPREELVNGVYMWTYTAGSLGREVGRTSRAIREWLHEGVLPGATAYIEGAAYFSIDYCAAVKEACRRIYYLDGRGFKAVLKRIIREELARRQVSYVPPKGDNVQDRVVATVEASA